MNIERVKWYKPYKRCKGGRCQVNGAIPNLEAKAGVYLIRDGTTKEVVYIGHSRSSVYKTMFRHFQEWDDPTQYRATYDPKGPWEVRIIPTKKGRAPKLEKYLITKFLPRDAEQKYPDFKPRPGTKRKIEGDLKKAGLMEEEEKAPF